MQLPITSGFCFILFISTNSCAKSSDQILKKKLGRRKRVQSCLQMFNRKLVMLSNRKAASITFNLLLFSAHIYHSEFTSSSFFAHLQKIQKEVKKLLIKLTFFGIEKMFCVYLHIFCIEIVSYLQLFLFFLLFRVSQIDFLIIKNLTIIPFYSFSSN